MSPNISRFGVFTKFLSNFVRRTSGNAVLSKGIWVGPRSKSDLSPMQFRYCKLSAFIKVLLVLKVSEANILIYQIEWVTFGCVDYSECQPRCRMKRVIEIWIQLIILLPLLISTFYDLKAFKWPKGTQSAMAQWTRYSYGGANRFISHHFASRHMFIW